MARDIYRVQYRMKGLRAAGFLRTMGAYHCQKPNDLADIAIDQMLGRSGISLRPMPAPPVPGFPDWQKIGSTAPAGTPAFRDPIIRPSKQQIRDALDLVRDSAGYRTVISPTNHVRIAQEVAHFLGSSQSIKALVPEPTFKKLQTLHATDKAQWFDALLIAHTAYSMAERLWPQTDREYDVGTSVQLSRPEADIIEKQIAGESKRRPAVQWLVSAFVAEHIARELGVSIYYSDMIARAPVADSSKGMSVADSMTKPGPSNQS